MIRTEQNKNIQIPEIQDEGVIFSSKNATWILEYYKNLSNPIYVVGESTAQHIQHKYAFKTIIVAENAKDLVKKISNKSTNSYIYFSGKKRREELPEALKDMNKNFKEVQVYETTLVPQEIEEPYDGIAFLSPSSVQSYLKLNTFPENSTIFALGTTTASELKPFNDRLLVAKEPNLNSLFLTIEEHFNV